MTLLIERKLLENLSMSSIKGTIKKFFITIKKLLLPRVLNILKNHPPTKKEISGTLEEGESSRAEGSKLSGFSSFSIKIRFQIKRLNTTPKLVKTASFWPVWGVIPTLPKMTSFHSSFYSVLIRHLLVCLNMTFRTAGTTLFHTWRECLSPLYETTSFSRTL